MIIDIIVIFKFYLIFNSIDNGGVRIRYPCSNTDTSCYNTKTVIPLDKLYVIDESDKLQLHYL